MLNLAQRQAVETTGPLLIMAGAGSGKTTVLVQRVAHLIEQGVAPENILLLTFTNKAAEEMRTRATKLTAAAANITACTYHSLCLDIIRSHPGLSPLAGYNILSQDRDVQQIYRIAMDTIYWNPGKHEPNAKDVQRAISLAVNTDQDLTTVTAGTALQFRVPQLHTVIQLSNAYKAEHQYATFDDLLLECRRLLREHPALQKELSKRYQYIMVDEYQDTNALQADILLELRKGSDEIAVVGDDAQAIYGFNGANVENIRQFTTAFPNATVIDLNENYRSTNEILTLSNSIINCNMIRGSEKHMKSATDIHGARPQLIKTGHDAQAVLTELQRLHDLYGIPWSEIAILIRSGRDSWRVELQLDQAKIPWRKFGGFGFFDNPHVHKVLAILRVLLNPDDDIRWNTWLSLYPSIGEKTAAKYSPVGGNVATLIRSGIPIKIAGYLREIYNKYYEWRTLPYQQMVQDVTSYYLKTSWDTFYLSNASSATKEKQAESLTRAEQDLQALVDMACAYPTLADFLESIATAPKKTPDEDEPYLTISTIHSAKGKEWSAVLVLQVYDGGFPRRGLSDTEDEEELHCFYVATTRAKKILQLYQPTMSLRGDRTEQARYLNGCEAYYDVRYV